MDAEFGEEIACVRAGGVNADLEMVRDFFGSEAFDEEGQEIVLAWRERNGLRDGLGDSFRQHGRANLRPRSRKTAIAHAVH